MCCLLKPVWADVFKQVSRAVMSVALCWRVSAESTYYQTGPRLNTIIIIIIIIIIIMIKGMFNLPD